MLTKNMLLGACVLLLVTGALWWSVDRRSESDVSLVPFRREVEEVLKVIGKGVGKIAGRDVGEDGYEDLRQGMLANFREAAELLNKDAPRPVGDSLLLKGAEASGNGPSMTYTYVVKGGLTVGMEAMEPVMRAVCGEPDMRDYMQHGVFYRYVYEDTAGKELMSFKVDERTCESIESRESPESPGPAPRPAPGEQEPGGAQEAAPADGGAVPADANG